MPNGQRYGHFLSNEYLNLQTVHPTPPNTRVTIVIPAYNEEQTIGRVLVELSALGFTDVIVIDDGSQDRTANVALEHGAQVIRHPYNIGNGAAVKAGIRAASGDTIVLMDGDGQHPPTDVPKLLALAADYDMVVGERASASQTLLHRRLANKVFNFYVSYLVGHPIPDLTSGFRVVRADILKRFVYLLPNGFSYPSTITIVMFRSGFRVRYQPFTSPARTGNGVSKIRPLRDGLLFLLTITRLGVLFRPLKIFLPVSFALGIVGVGYSAYLLIYLTRFSHMAALLLLASLITFLIGLVAEQNAVLHLALSEVGERGKR